MPAWFLPHSYCPGLRCPCSRSEVGQAVLLAASWENGIQLALEPVEYPLSHFFPVVDVDTELVDFLTVGGDAEYRFRYFDCRHLCAVSVAALGQVHVEEPDAVVLGHDLLDGHHDVVDALV